MLWLHGSCNPDVAASTLANGCCAHCHAHVVLLPACIMLNAAIAAHPIITQPQPDHKSMHT